MIFPLLWFAVPLRILLRYKTVWPISSDTPNKLMSYLETLPILTAIYYHSTLKILATERLFSYIIHNVSNLYTNGTRSAFFRDYAAFLLPTSILGYRVSVEMSNQSDWFILACLLTSVHNYYFI